MSVILIPRQFAWTRAAGDAATLPQMIVREDKSILYQFKPQMASAQRFEKIGGGPGYIWGFGSGYLEYTVPERDDRRQVSEIIVRAHIQPVLPVDAPPGFVKTRVTLFVEGWNGGSRLIPVEPKGQPIIQEWRLTGRLLRLRAMRGLPLTIRFAVTPDPTGSTASTSQTGPKATTRKTRSPSRWSCATRTTAAIR